MQRLKYKYRLFPNKTQEQQLNQIVGSCRYVYNFYLENEIELYKHTGKFNWQIDNCCLLTNLKKQQPFLQEVPAVALQQSIRRLHTSLKQAMPGRKARKGFPKFKSRHENEQSFRMVMITSKQNKDKLLVNRSRHIKDNKLVISKSLKVRMKMHRELPDNIDFSSFEVKRKNNKWYVTFNIEVPKQPKVKIVKAVGIDINSKKYVFSDHHVLMIPKFLSENQVKIKQLQRELSRKKKGSNNRAKARLKLARLHEHIANQRWDWFNKETKRIVDNYDLICLEDLNVKEIQQRFGRITRDNLFGAFRSMIEYKAELYGKYVSIIDRYEPTSKKCSSCQKIHASLKLSERTYNCPSCGVEIDRDLNAALNIVRAGTSLCGSAPTAFKSNSSLIQAIVGTESKQEAIVL
jgi:putative transposase